MTATTSITLTVPPSYTVTFNGNGSTGGATATETTNVPTPLTLNGFSRLGFAFSGWNTLAGGTGTSYADGATYPFAAAVTLYAQWTADPATSVTFNGNGSTGGATATETTNVPSPLTLNGFSRLGFAFSGWNTLAGGTGTPTPTAPPIPSPPPSRCTPSGRRTRPHPSPSMATARPGVQRPPRRPTSRPR